MFNRSKKTQWGKIIASAAVLRGISSRTIVGSLGAAAAAVAGYFAIRRFAQHRRARFAE